jgi:hypothetical protein
MMPEHRCQHLFDPGWTPPDRSPVRAGTADDPAEGGGVDPGGTGPTSTIAHLSATVAGIAIVLAVTVVAGWVALGAAWAGGMQ